MTISPSSDSQCERGHDVNLVGRNQAGRCNACVALLSRLRTKHDQAPKPCTIDYQAIEAIRTNRLLELYDCKDRAGTQWERDKIQRKIDELR